MDVPAEATDICARCLAALDEHAPGLVVGLYLVGSIALGDYRPDRSDIDFVAVSSRPARLADVAPVHAALSSRPAFDGIYVTLDDLRRPAENVPVGVAIIDGRLHAESAAERHAVTWLTLARHGIAIHGPSAGTLGIHADIASARRHARGNLASYWVPWLARHRGLLPPASLASLTGGATQWSILGAARLHATITEGLLLSKSAAGSAARAAFPRHADIIGHALALRAGENVSFAGGILARRRAMLAALDDIISAGLSHPS